MKRQFTAHATLAALALAPGQALALGFGRVVSDTVLGQPLSFTVPVRVDAGERFGEDCVHTLVFFGEGQLPPNQVATAVERGAGDSEWRVRVTTTGPVNEPVVDVALEVGCARPFARRFTVFADPPAVPWTAQLAQAEAAQGDTAAAPTGVAAHAKGASGASGASFAAVAKAAGMAPSERAASSSLRPVVRKGPTVALANAVAARHAASRHRGPLAPPASAPAPAAAAAAQRLQSAETSPRLELSAGFGGPRLRMEIDDPEIPAPAAAALSQQVEGDTQQLESLQHSIAGLRRDSQAGRAQAERLQAALAESESRSQWLPWLAGLFGLALASALVLAWRLRQQSRLAHSRWYEESQLLASAQPPEPSPTVPVSAIAPAPAATPAQPRPVQAQVAEDVGGAIVHDMSITAPVDVAAVARAKAMAPVAPVPAAVAPPPAHEVSVEELLDIEQQADFFVALGQEDAAIDLLTAHVRATGVQSPLPYAKLLELHRRLDDTEAYERVRERFERRFGAPAPEWATGPSAGRALEDYPEAMTRVQIVWRAAADAMVLLESLLFKRDPADTLLDLPAYRDLLLLYSVARDNVQHGVAAEPDHVDFLLPIGDLASAMASMAHDAVHEGRHDADLGDVAVPSTTFDPPEAAPGARSGDLGEVHATLDLTPLDFDISEPGEFRQHDEAASRVRH